MTINFSQYVEGEKLSVSFMLPLRNSSSDYDIGAIKLITEEVLRENDKNIRKYIRKKEKKRNELLSEITKFLQNNTYTTELSLGDNFFLTEIIVTLAQSSCLQNIEKLNIISGTINAKGVNALAQSPYLQNLRELNLSFQDINVEHVKTLLQSPYLQNLTKLSIDNWSIDCKTIEAIAELCDPRIELGKFLGNEYKSFYNFLLQRACLNERILDEKEVKKIVMDLVSSDYNGKVIEHILENRDKYPFSVSDIGQTLLYYAVIENWIKPAEILMKMGVDINVVDPTGKTPFITAKNINLCSLMVNHIARLEAVHLHVSEKNLQKKNEFINTSTERYNHYTQHRTYCKEEVKKMKKRNESLYNFLRENDINEMADVWEQNENVHNEFDNEKSLKEKYPEYANILINKADKVKKEIFLHNHKSLIDVLSQNYREDFQKMSFAGIKNFFMSHRNDYSSIREESGVTLINCLDFEDVKKRHTPQLTVRAFAQMIKNKFISSNLECPSNEQLQAVGQDCFLNGQVSLPTNEITDAIEHVRISDSEHNDAAMQNTQPRTLVVDSRLSNTGIEGNEEKQALVQPAEPVSKNAQSNSKQPNYTNKNNPNPQDAKSKLPVIAASLLAITGVAVAVYLEMLAVGIAVGACCLVITAITYYCNSPANLLENSNVKVVANQIPVENYNLR